VGSREFKRRLLELLDREDQSHVLREICRLPGRQVVNPLFSLFYSPSELIRWRAITAMGAVVSMLAEQDVEQARAVMRRLMWNLNDESGGIGWGSPEAMGEIMARHEQLAAEYHPILISYIRPEGNYIEHPMLQRGVLWGLGRLTQVRPRLLRDEAHLLLPYLEADDVDLRGLAAWTSGMLGAEPTRSMLERLKGDTGRLNLFCDGRLRTTTVAELAGAGADRIA
jgi:hypothetical protein